MADVFLAAFVTFFVVIDPPGVAPMFAALTEGTPQRHVRLMAFKSVGIAAVILLAFAYGGEWLLAQLHVTLDAFRIAGGVLLFLLALDMLFEKRQERRDERTEAYKGDEPDLAHADISVFPLAIPLIAGPGAIASVLLFMNETPAFADRAMVLGALGVNLATCLVMFLFARPLMKVMGKTFAATFTRVLGLVLAALSTQFIIDGISGAFFAA